MKIISDVTRPTVIVLAMSVFFLAGCDHAPQNTAQTSAPVPAAAPAKKDMVADNIDTSVNPGDDFFTFANGAWLKKNPIPSTEASWGIGFLVRDDLYGKLRKISEDSAQKTGATPGSDEQKIGDFWRTAMDDALAEKQGLAPIKAELDRIDAAKNLSDISTPRSRCSRSVRPRCSTGEFSKTKSKAT